jgi:hypothetical protein
MNFVYCNQQSAITNHPGDGADISSFLGKKGPDSEGNFREARMKSRKRFGPELTPVL